MASPADNELGFPNLRGVSPSVSLLGTLFQVRQIRLTLSQLSRVLVRRSILRLPRLQSP